MKRFLFLAAMAALFSCSGTPAGMVTPQDSAEREAFNMASQEPRAESKDSEDARRLPEGPASSESRAGADVPPSPATPATTPAPSGRPQPTQSGLRAGFSDDNKEYNRFLSFLERFRGLPHRPLDVAKRFVLQYRDSAGLPAANVRIQVYAGSRLEAEGVTTADGRFLFFAPATGPAVYRVQAQWQGRTDSFNLPANGNRVVETVLQQARRVPDVPAVDIAFVFDTTGSMGDEIARLQDTIQIIQMNLASVGNVRLRFGMVLYKDVEDEYRTLTVPFTSNVEAFQTELDKVTAMGGGDLPEDLEAALEESLRLDWNADGIRMSFVITDAPTQQYPDQRLTYAGYAKEALKRGIRTHTIGTGGLPTAGEYVLRQISQYTGGRYIFLNYGESGDSEGGAAGSVSHHIGANFQTDKLESIIIRFAREDIAAFTGRPLESGEDYFEANRIEEEEKERTLQTLFTRALEQLADYASIGLTAGTPTLYLPVTAAPADASTAEFFAASLLQAGARSGFFKPVERADLQRLLEEMELSLSAAFDPGQAPRVGNLVGAQLILTGQLQERSGKWDLFLRLIRVETGEILSVSRSRLDKNLGL